MLRAKFMRSFSHEFCSTWFRRDGAAIPQSWPKTLYRLMGSAPDSARLVQFCYEMRAMPQLPEMKKFIQGVWAAS